MRSVCKKCGVEHLTPLGYPACKAHTKRGACRANPVRGATVCSKHGLTKAVRGKAAERVVAEKVAATHGELMERYRRPGQHPYELLIEVAEGMAVVTRMVQQHLADLSTTAPDDDTRAAMNLYRDHARALAPVAKMLLDANLEERLAQIEEAKTVLLASVVRLAMVDADLSPPQAEAMRVAVAARLRALPTA
jgi:hypothetical protein